MRAGQKMLSEAVEDFVRWRRANMNATTAAGDGHVLRRFVREVGDRQLRHLTGEVVQEWFVSLAESHVIKDGSRRDPIQPSTHNYYLRRLRAFVRFATQRGWLRQDPLMEVQPKRAPRKRRQQPGADVLLEMLDHAKDGRDRAWIATTINTALRASEICRLRVGDVDLAEGWLSVTVSKSPEDVLFPITSDLDGELRRWLVQYEADLGRPLRPDDHLFPARRAGVYKYVPLEAGGFDKQRTADSWCPERPATKTQAIVQRALQSLGLPTMYEGTHTVRRAVARAFFDSMAGDTGYDAALRTVSALLHHKSSATTEIYLGLSSERKRRDDRMRGQPFLSAMVTRDNVTPLRREA